MKAVRCEVGVFDVDEETVTRPRIDNRAGNTPVERRLVDVGDNELVGLWNQIMRIEILAIDQCRQTARFYLVRWDCGVLMARRPHAVPPILHGRRYMVVGLDR